jgi:2Fe-2S iron-sulfur cluster binding domain
MQFPGDENQDGIERTADDLFEPYSRLIPIYIKNREYMVPENNTLLRVLQYLNEEVAYGNFCWNGDCRNCQILIRRDADSQDVMALACLTKVVPGLHIIKLPPGVSVEAPAVEG